MIDMKHFPIIVFLFFFFFVLCCSRQEQQFRLYILHTNDIHARLDPFDQKESLCRPESNSECFGGIARRAGFVNEFRKNHENVLLLDAGDQFQGTPWFYVYKGVEASHFLNLLKYDAMALGNHEFDNGVQGLVPFLENVTVPILCSNLVKDANVPEKMNSSILSHVVVERQGRKIGIVGYITSAVPSLSNTGNLSFAEEKVSVGTVARELKEAGVDIIVALGHSGMVKDQEMAAELRDVDVFVGGHTHSLFYAGHNPYGDEVSAPYPLAFERGSASVSLVVQAGSLGKYVGLLNLTFDAEGKIIQWSGNPVAMDKSVPEDEPTKMAMRQLEARVGPMYTAVIGISSVDLDASEGRCRLRECNIGNLHTDAMVHAARKLEKWKYLNLAVSAGGTFRTSLAKGSITLADLIALLPFGNRLTVIEAPGSLLTEMLEHSVAAFDPRVKNGKFLQMAGMRVTYGMRKRDGSRVEKVEMERCHRCRTYVDLDPRKTYPLILDNYLLSGGDGYNMLKHFKGNTFKTDLLDTEVLESYVREYSPVAAAAEGRIRGMESFPGWKAVPSGADCVRTASKLLDILLLLSILFFWH